MHDSTLTLSVTRGALTCIAGVIGVWDVPVAAQSPHGASTGAVVVPLRRGGTVVETVQGDPTVAGAPYVIRIHNNDNFSVFPHTHPHDENIVVLEGTWHLGSGARFDRSKLQPIRPGDFVSVPGMMPHFAWSEGQTIIQVHGIGPFRVNFVDPAFRLAEAARDTSILRYFAFRPGDSVAFATGQGIVRDGMASPANGIVQYLIEDQGSRELVIQEQVLRSVQPRRSRGPRRRRPRSKVARLAESR